MPLGGSPPRCCRRRLRAETGLSRPLGVPESLPVADAAWIGPRLAAFDSHTTASVIPGGFDGYARILHPARRGDTGGEQQVRWSEVASWSGAALTRTVQFQQIALPAHPVSGPPPWESGPREGPLAAAEGAILADILATASQVNLTCLFGIWEGYGDLDVLPEPVLRQQRLDLPGRRYLLYRGKVRDALRFVPVLGRTPNLWWPDDHSWFVASEVDLDWTYVAGPLDMISGLLAETRLETRPVELDDSCVYELGEPYQALVAEAARALRDQGYCTISTPLGRVDGRLAGSGARPWLEIERQQSSGYGSSRSRTIIGSGQTGHLESQLGMALKRLTQHP